MPRPIDRKRPLRDALGDQIQGIPRIIMYYDEPGVYYAPDGSRYDEKTVRDAGVDVDGDKKLQKISDLKKKHVDEIQALETRLQQEEIEVLEEGTQKIDAAAHPELEPMVFNAERGLRETKSLKMVTNDEDDTFEVLHKISGESLGEKLAGADAVQQMITWHADHPEDTGEKEEEEVDDLFSESV